MNEYLLPSVVMMIAGLVNLLFGRRLFWLFVGLGGFLLGILITITLLNDWNPIVTFLLSLVIGAAMAVLAIFARRPLAALGSFFGLGFMTLFVASLFNVGSPWNFIVAVIVGAIAAVVTYMIFEWALVVNSSLSGASAIIAGVTMLLPFFNEWDGWPASVLAALLATAGIFFQSRELIGEPLAQEPVSSGGTASRSGQIRS